MGDGSESTIGTPEYEIAQMKRRIAELEAENAGLKAGLEIATNVANDYDPELVKMLRRAAGLPATD